MSKIMSYSEYKDSKIATDGATLKIEGEDMIFSYNGKDEKLTMSELTKHKEDGAALKIKEAVVRLGAKRIADFDKLEEFVKGGFSFGTSGAEKKGFFANALSKLFRREKSHITYWGIVMGDDADPRESS